MPWASINVGALIRYLRRRRLDHFRVVNPENELSPAHKSAGPSATEVSLVSSRKG